MPNRRAGPCRIPGWGRQPNPNPIHRLGTTRVCRDGSCTPRRIGANCSALRTVPGFPGGVDGGQQEPDQDPNNRDDDEEFDEGKSNPLHSNRTFHRTMQSHPVMREFQEMLA